MQISAYDHEMEHINKGDYYYCANVNEIKVKKHSVIFYIF